jgi:uncharacterized protein YbcI
MFGEKPVKAKPQPAGACLQCRDKSCQWVLDRHVVSALLHFLLDSLSQSKVLGSHARGVSWVRTMVPEMNPHRSCGNGSYATGRSADIAVNTEKYVRTKGQLEAEISEAIIKFEKEYMGRGPDETKTYILEDMVLVRLRGVLTPAEKNLARIDGGSQQGRALIKQVRIELLEKARPMLEALVQDITGCKMRSLHTDISTSTGERVIIFTLDGLPQFEERKTET